MLVLRKFKIRKHERGLFSRDGEFRAILGEGNHWFIDPFRKVTVDIVSVRDAFLKHRDLEVIVKSGELLGEARVVDLRDHQRAIVWIDGRIETVLGAGLYVLWTAFHDVQLEFVDARPVRFEHERLPTVLAAAGGPTHLERHEVEAGHVGLFFKDGAHEGTLPPGTHAFWKGMGRVQVDTVDLRETILDVSGQEIMTADKVTLRMNASITYRVVNPRRAVTEVEDAKQALYRDAQLALRAAIGTKDLDGLLSDKDEMALQLEGILKNKASGIGIEVKSVGIRDVILPGDMKDLMNKVTEAKKAAEASNITRREETAAMRSQANTARILQSNPTLMRLRELEVLEKVSEKATLNVVLGEKGLVDRVAKLL